MMKTTSVFFATAAGLLLLASPALAGVEARIDIASQRMKVYVDGSAAYEWVVSTGRSGFDTPRGAWTTERAHARYYSRKYDGAPMPYAVFFTGGVAVHGTNDIKHLGRPASHGCVRLHPDNARAFYSLVRQYGLENSRVVISD